MISFLIFILVSVYGYKRFLLKSKSFFSFHEENQNYKLYEKKESIQIENNQTKVKKHVQPPKRMIDLTILQVKEEWDEGEIPWDVEI